MEISYTLHEKDLKEFSSYFYFKKILKKRIGLLVVVPFIITLWVRGRSGFEPVGFLKDYLINALIFCATYLLFIRIAFKFSGKLPSKKLKEPKRFRLNMEKDGLTLVEKDLRLPKIHWNEIISVEQNKNYIFIFIDKINALILPKRAFKDAAMKDRFLENVIGKTTGLKPEKAEKIK